MTAAVADSSQRRQMLFSDEGKDHADRLTPALDIDEWPGMVGSCAGKGMFAYYA